MYVFLKNFEPGIFALLGGGPVYII